MRAETYFQLNNISNGSENGYLKSVPDARGPVLSLEPEFFLFYIRL